jgi:hypothetical protein
MVLDAQAKAWAYLRNKCNNKNEKQVLRLGFAIAQDDTSSEV